MRILPANFLSAEAIELAKANIDKFLWVAGEYGDSSTRPHDSMLSCIKSWGGSSMPWTELSLYSNIERAVRFARSFESIDAELASHVAINDLCELIGAQPIFHFGTPANQGPAVRFEDPLDGDDEGDVG